MKKRLLIPYLWALSTIILSAQSIRFEATIIEAHSKEALVGASFYFEDLKLGAVSDEDGQIVIENIPVGRQEINISFIGYHTIDTIIEINNNQARFIFQMEEEGEELEEVLIQVTRSTRTIRNIPTRIETIGGEELGEKAIMNPANISMVLRESTGIQTQQTSINSGNNSIRIQGLDGRHTQFLRDGFPIYAGFSEGLSLMQIPPLDLYQFEIIKGSSSTLYGGGAIAGLVNLVSKTPGEEQELDIMFTQTHALGSTGNLFYSGRKEKIGYTFYTSGHYQKAYDPDGNRFSNLPQTKSIALNPKLFIYPNDKSRLWFGVNASFDNRLGGDMIKIEEGPSGIHQFSEENSSSRLSTQAVFEKDLKEGQSIQLKNSFAFFDRNLNSSNTINFSGRQVATFSEFNYSASGNKADWILGANLYTDDFREQQNLSPRDQKDLTIGAFVNNITDLSNQWVLESGFRLDYAPDWGSFALPRLSLLWKINEKWSSRLGGGLGYKIPNIFTEEAATRNFANVLAVDKELLEAERSYGLNFDVNFKGAISEQISFSFNQLFYLTAIDQAILLNSLPNANFQFENAEGNVLSRGLESNIKFTYKDFRWFLNYAFINVTLDYLPGKPQKPLTPRHTAGNVLMYENEKWRIGLENYYIGSQRLSDGTKTEDYFLLGFLAQKHFEWGSPFVNFENITDRRQARFSSEVLGSIEDPIFPEIYAPTDGFIFSIGVIIKPFGNHHEHHH